MLLGVEACKKLIESHNDDDCGQLEQPKEFVILAEELPKPEIKKKSSGSEILAKLKMEGLFGAGGPPKNFVKSDDSIKVAKKETVSLASASTTYSSTFQSSSRALVGYTESKLGVIVEDLHVEDADEKDLESDMETLCRLRAKGRL